ncbi:PD40 domain-containing protein, partial [Candidatus Dependentiae bacterium]|nr:PD40 domain-containing protein [Candidatus Dependentiae bacterium]
MLTLKAQNDKDFENEVLKQADNYFKKENYAAALPLYSQLLSLQPKDAVLSFKFGASLLMADKRNTETPLRFLEYAINKKDVSPDLYYFLGLAYHINYRFQEAINAFNNYKSKSSDFITSKKDIDRQIEMCNNGKQLLSDLKDLFVLEKKTTNQTDYYRSYKINEFGGKLLAKPDVFKTKNDKKNNDNSIVFYSEKNKVIYYSSFGDKGNNRDIYRSFRLAKDQWSKPEKLPATINTEYDEDYPYILPDGKTLYFSSKGHNSMGGYDIFRSTYDKVLNKWTTPVNLDFSINTPYEDILFVTDTLQKYAYFSSTRNTAENMISIFKVRIDRRPDANILAKVVPKYSYTVQDSTYLNLLKQKEKLEVNSSEDMFDTPVADNNNENKTKAKGEIDEDEELNYNIPASKFKDNKEIINYSQELLEEVQNNEKIAENKKNIAANIIKKKKELATNKQRQLDSAIAQSKQNNDIYQKEQDKQNINKLKKETEKLKDEIKIAEKVEKQYTDLYENTRKAANEAAFYNNLIKKTDQTNDSSSAIVLLNELVNNDNYKKINKITIKTDNDEEQQLKQITQQKLKNETQKTEILKNIDELKKEADNYKAEAIKTKDKNLKQTYFSEAEDREKEIDKNRDQVNKILADNSKLDLKIDSINNSNILADNLTDEIDNIASYSDEQDSSIVTPTQEKTNKQDKLAEFKQPKSVNKKTDINKEKKIIKDNKTPIKKDTIYQEVTDNKIKTIQKKKQDNSKVIEENSIYINKIDDKKEKLENKAENIMKLALLKSKQAEKKEKQADSIIFKANTPKNKTQKDAEITKANTLKNDALKLKTESKTAYKIAKELENKIDEIEQVKDNLIATNKELENTQDSTEINKTTKEIKTKTEETLANIDKYDNINTNLKTPAPGETSYKEKEAKDLKDKSLILAKEQKKLQSKANALFSDAKSTINPIKKRKLQKEAAEIQAAADQKNKEVKKYKNLSDSITRDIKIQKAESTILTDLINQINNNNDSLNNIPSPTANDKQLLAENISKYEKETYTEPKTEQELREEKKATQKEKQLQKNSVIQKAGVYKKQISQNVETLKNLSVSLKKVSIEKNIEATKKGKEADSIIKFANTLTDKNAKNKEIEKAKKLQKDSTRLSNESIVAANTDLLVTLQIEEQKNYLKKVNNEVAEVENQMKNGNRDKADKLYADMNKKYKDNKKVDIKEIKNKINYDMVTLAEIKSEKADIVLEEAKKQNELANDINDEAAIYKEDADKTTNENKKKRLMERYNYIKNEADSVKNLTNKLYREGNLLKIEAGAIRSQVKFATTMIQQSIKDQAAKDKKTVTSEVLVDNKINNENEEQSVITENNNSKDTIPEGLSDKEKLEFVLNKDKDNNIQNQITSQTIEEAKIQNRKTTADLIIKNKETLQNKLKKTTNTLEKQSIQKQIKTLDSSLTAIDYKTDNKKQQKGKPVDIAKTSRKLENEAKSEYKQVEKLKNNANNEKDPVKKNELIKKADNLKKEADKKQVDAYTLENLNNQNKYLENNLAIEQNKPLNEIENDTTKILKYEVVFYFKQAEVKRNLAEKTVDNIKKIELLKEASANEKTAINKQEEILDIYQKKQPLTYADNKNINNKKEKAEQIKSDSINFDKNLLIKNRREADSLALVKAQQIKNKKISDSIAFVRTKQTKEKRATDSLALVKAQQIKNKKISDSIAFVRTKQTKEKRTTDSLALIKA